MDSGNSGSLQSSSGGDEEYDSRAAESVSAFMNSNPPPFFDPLSNYSTLLNPPPAWPTTRPGPTHHMMNTLPPFTPSFHLPPPSSSPTVTPPPQNQNPGVARASKKRSRASRRAPTTVLTTDTSNFRAMVQEFTGIPAPPFNNNSSSTFPRNRLDLFSTRSAAPPPPYLRRPFPQKLHSLSTTTTASASSSFQLPPSQNSNLFNLPNPLLTSLLQSNPKFPFSNSAPKMMGGLDEQFSLGSLGHGGNHVSDALAALPSLIHSDQMGVRNNNDHQNDGVGNNNNNAARWNDKDDGVGGYNFERNYAAAATSASSFHGGKVPENVGGRGEGNMVESWICSSE